MLTSRALRLCIGVAAGLLLLWVLAWLALSPLLKWQLQTRGSELLGRELRVGGVEFAPASLALTLHDLSIAGAEGAEAPQLQVQRVFIDLMHVLCVWRRIAALRSCAWLRLARLSTAATTSTTCCALRRRRSGSRAQRFALQPESRRRRVQLTIVLSAHACAAAADAGAALPVEPADDLQVTVEPRLAFELDGSRFDNQGRTTPFAEGRTSEFQIRFDALALEPLWAYLPDAVPLRPVGGSLSADLKLNFEQPPQQPPKVELSGLIELHRLDLLDPDKQPLLSWEKLQVQLGVTARTWRRCSSTARLLCAARPMVRPWLASGGGAAAQPAAVDAPAPWQLQLDALALQGAQVRGFTRRCNPRPRPARATSR